MECQQPDERGCWLAGIEPTAIVTVRLAPLPPVTDSFTLSPEPYAESCCCSSSSVLTAWPSMAVIVSPPVQYV